MKVEQIVKIFNEETSKWFNLNPPVNAPQICDWLIWKDGIYFNPDVMPMFQGTMTQRMNEIAMDMLLKGEY